MSRDIFLSHRSVDKDFVRQLAADIEDTEFQGRNLMTWLDEAEIRPGQSIVKMVNEGLENSRFIGLILTPAYFESQSGWTDAEWHAALNVDPDNRRGRIVPLLVQDCPYQPFLLRHLKEIDFRGRRYAEGLRELLAVLRDEPLPRPVTHRGQLIQPGGKIDRASLIAERAIPDADPEPFPEKLYCNLLPVETLPQAVYVAPIARTLRRPKADGTEALPTKRELKALILAAQKDAGIERTFMPAFRVVRDEIITFHDLESPESPLATVVDSDQVEPPFRTRDFLSDEDDRRLVTSLLNMAIARHLHGRGLLIDDTRQNRFFFPPKDGGPHVVAWRPLRKRAERTVAKPLTPDDPKGTWIHQAAYIKAVFLASKFYLQVTPTWVLTNGGYQVRGGPSVGRLVIRWTGRERNIHVLYHVRFWTSTLRRGLGPVAIRVGDQTMEVATIPAFIQQAYGVQDDHMNLMELLDHEAPLIAEEEETSVEVETIYDEEESEVFDVDILSAEEPNEDADEEDEE